MRPKILLAGLGETGALLAELISATYDVVAIDTERAVSDRVHGIDPTGERLLVIHGDASSAVVLRRLDAEGFLAAVGCSGSDEVNLEFLRLAHRELAIDSRLALMHDLHWEHRYRDEGIEVVSQDRACAAILASQLEPGQQEVVGIGRGRGEVLQVGVLHDSAVIGRRLADLHPRRWLVGAIYRDDQLIVPHGDTVFEQGDDVLLIGDPEILPSIAALVRSGQSEFPLQHGSNVVTLCNDRVGQVLDETGYLIESTRAERLEAIACEAERPELEALAATCEEKDIPCELSCTGDDALDRLLEEVRRRDVGVLVCPPRRLPILSRIGLGRSDTARIIDQVDSPVLVCRGTFPYRRVLLALAELPFHAAAARLAIDLVGTVGAELHLGVSHQPLMVEGADHRERIEERRVEIENLASLYRLKVETHILEGNPIHQFERLSRDFELLILPYPRGRSSFLTRPDVGLNLIHRSHCSVMVLPHDPVA